MAIVKSNRFDDFQNASEPNFKEKYGDLEDIISPSWKTARLVTPQPSMDEQRGLYFLVCVNMISGQIGSKLCAPNPPFTGEAAGLVDKVLFR